MIAERCPVTKKTQKQQSTRKTVAQLPETKMELENGHGAFRADGEPTAGGDTGKTNKV